jgi:hypothetical protein
MSRVAGPADAATGGNSSTVRANLLKTMTAKAFSRRQTLILEIMGFAY